MYRELTRNILIEAEPTYIPEQSIPERSYHFFSYAIRVVNRGDVSVQLMSRRWIITDGNGRVSEVEGPGVIGHQPKIPPGESFEYSSFCPLSTPTGNMRGRYVMRIEETGEEFEARIPLFFLRSVKPAELQTAP